LIRAFRTTSGIYSATTKTTARRPLIATAVHALIAAKATTAWSFTGFTEAAAPAALVA